MKHPLAAVTPKLTEQELDAITPGIFGLLDIITEIKRRDPEKFAQVAAERAKRDREAAEAA